MKPLVPQSVSDFPQPTQPFLKNMTYTKLGNVIRKAQSRAGRGFKQLSAGYQLQIRLAQEELRLTKMLIEALN